MAKIAAAGDTVAELRKALLGWYRRHRRDLPWRRSRDPYAIWVSEIMLQQTRVAAVVERYEAFMARFPTVVDLAAASEQEVLALWSGLGYYRRARMLHQAARDVAGDCGGRLPGTAEALRSLPGIGAYTSAAIASIAFGEPVAVVDGNVERVLCRLAGWHANGGEDSRGLDRKIHEMAARLVDPQRPGDFNQAMMELGATVCLPRNPQCLLCPLSVHCKTRGEHKTASRPRAVKRETAHALCVRAGGKSNGSGGSATEVLLEQRPPSATVMPDLWELPALCDDAAPDTKMRMTVRHAIMNVNYVVRIHDVAEAEIAQLTRRGGKRRWVRMSLAGDMALTGLTRKVLTRAHLLPVRASNANGAVLEES